MQPTPEMIERMRQTGIRLDREGRLWHEGQVIGHRGLKRTLLRWLDVLDDGRPILRLDKERYAYVEVEDAHLIAVSARWQGNRVFLRLNDESDEELAYNSLVVGDNDALYCRVRGGRLEARLSTSAHMSVAQNIEQAESGFVLRAVDRVFAIGRRDSK